MTRPPISEPDSGLGAGPRANPDTDPRADPGTDPRTDPGTDARAAELAHEQAAVDQLYGRLDLLRAQVTRDLDRVRRAATTATAAALAERDAFEALYAQRLDQLRRVADRLVFGRVDLIDGAAHHIGRIGLSQDGHQLLLDWRAPVAAAFYQATAAEPGDVVRRRHLSTRARQVTALEDEVLRPDRLAEDAVVVSGPGALFGALESARTGRMRDIVATVQAEQDRVIRAPLGGVLVVQGGPGTGKTAVALHRAAYLLFTHRDRIARSGVLLVGPSPTFLRYISAVLPSLGETGVVTATPTSLVPGVTPTGDEPRATAALKGDPVMAGVLAAAVRERQRVPEQPQQLAVDGVEITMWPRDVRAARDRARRTGEAHLVARRTFALDLLDRLATRWATASRTELDAAGRRDAVTLLRETPAVVRAVNRCWLPVDAQRLLRDLFADADRLARCAPTLSAQQRQLLLRDPDQPWTAADVPLLDEAAELLGVDDGPARAAAARAADQRRAELAYAGEVTRLSGTSGMVSADALADRYTGAIGTGPGPDDGAGGAETYGHVIVDEAQELSAMAWRMLVRRCPSRSMTVVGDIAQTGSPGGAGSWARVFDPIAPDRWRMAELTVNYRTPGPIMELAGRALQESGALVSVPRSARVDGDPPVRHQVSHAGLGSALAALVRQETAVLAEDGGTLAVLTAAADLRSCRKALLADGVMVAEGPAGAEGADGIADQLAVLDVAQAKGLEFDVVIVVEPAAIVAGSERGYNDLYVALTRPTRRLHLLHASPLPAPLRAP